MNILKSIVILLILIVLAGCSGSDDNKVFTGVLEGTSITVSSPVSEKFIRQAVEEGQPVTKGQFTGLIDTTQLHLQISQIRLSMEEISLQQKSNRIKLKQLTDAYKHAFQKLERNKKLLGEKAVPDQLVKDLNLEVDRLEKEIENLKINGLLLEKKRMTLRTQLEIVQNNLNKAILLSPTDGYVEKIYVDEGEYIAPMSPIMDIVNLKNPWCYIYVAESTLPELSIGTPVTATIDGDSTTYSGTITFISKHAEFTPKEILTPDNRTALVFAVKVELQNKNNRLKAGMPVEIKIRRSK